MHKIGSIMIILSMALLIGVAPCEAFDEPYTCSIAFSASQGLDECPPCSSSVGPICIQRVDWDNSRAVLRVDLEGYSKLSLTNIEMINPDAWVLNIGNSPTNNGYAGDASTFSHDSELQIQSSEVDGINNTIFRVYSNDYSHNKPDPDPQPILTVAKTIKSRHKIGINQLDVWDKHVFLKAHHMEDISLASSYIFRANNDTDSESNTGYNDFIYWIGLNRVVSPIYSDCYRCGSGITKAEFTLLP